MNIRGHWIILIILFIVYLSFLNGCSSPVPDGVVPTLTGTSSTSTEALKPSTESPIPSSLTPEPSETPTLLPTPTQTLELSPTPMLNPFAGGYHPMAYDSESDKIVLVPRLGNNRQSLNSQTWLFDFNTKTWQQMPDGPPDGEGPMAYDSQSDRIILFLGARGSLGSIFALGQTWAYDTNTDTWTNMEPTESPSGLFGARMVYDSESDRMILFAGFDVETLSDKPETWAYDYETNTWSNLQPTGDPPPGSNYFAMSYDTAADRVIAWRRGFNPESQMLEFKIGTYDYNSNTWEQREIERHPDAYDYSTMVYDPGTGLNILFGGLDREGQPKNEIWGYDYETNTWKMLNSKNPPSARGWHAMIFDDQAGVVAVFGGGAAHNEFTDETWVYDPESGEWTNSTAYP